MCAAPQRSSHGADSQSALHRFPRYTRSFWKAKTGSSVPAQCHSTGRPTGGTRGTFTAFRGRNLEATIDRRAWHCPRLQARPQLALVSVRQETTPSTGGLARGKLSTEGPLLGPKVPAAHLLTSQERNQAQRGNKLPRTHSWNQKPGLLTFGLKTLCPAPSGLTPDHKERIMPPTQTTSWCPKLVPVRGAPGHRSSSEARPPQKTPALSALAGTRIPRQLLGPTEPSALFKLGSQLRNKRRGAKERCKTKRGPKMKRNQKDTYQMALLYVCSLEDPLE